MYEITVRDSRIHAYRVVKGETRAIAEAKAEAQLAVWDERAARKQTAEEVRTEKQERQSVALEGAEEARALTEKAAQTIKALEMLLKGLLADPVASWPDFKDQSSFMAALPDKPIRIQPLLGPLKEIYAVDLTLFDRLIRSRGKAKIQAADEKYQSALAAWHREVELLERGYASKVLAYEAEIEAWQRTKLAQEEKQTSHNQLVDRLLESYISGAAESAMYLVEQVLNRTTLPENFPVAFDCFLNADEKVLVVDFELPNTSILPKHKQINYVASRQAFRYVPTTDAWRKSTYDSILYQTALGIIYRIFVADTRASIHSVVFNGWVHSIDPSTGAEVHACILSLQAGRDEFLPLDLTRVDPKACFKNLKGVASSRLVDLTPIRPILNLNKQDSRFVEAYAVAGTLDDRTNLAAMDWQDFENLIREIFEKEFVRSGGEVRITRASRDGGVDAVVFDPDPLRGGKIVIQAKRYTNTVGVGAVRDLYGTVQHEGAMKGILVTTATYGPDAYEFARDKPLTLISGAELLGMLERHGHRAKINLAEARALRQ